MKPEASERRGGAGVFVTSDETPPQIVDGESRHASASFGVAEAYFTADGSGPCEDDAKDLASCLRSEGYNQASAYHCVSCMVNSMLGVSPRVFECARRCDERRLRDGLASLKFIFYSCSNIYLKSCSEMGGLCDEVASCYEQRNCTVSVLEHECHANT